MNTRYLTILGGVFLILLSSFIFQNNEWVAPEEASMKMNPVEPNEKSLKLGKKVYNKMCWTCHGSEGKGDGPASATLTPKPADFTNQKIQDQKDGALFWKITTGKGTMASYKNSLTEDQRWAVVNYIRTLKK
jgi:mono/diheme cytochrome c family protein